MIVSLSPPPTPQAAPILSLLGPLSGLLSTHIPEAGVGAWFVIHPGAKSLGIPLGVNFQIQAQGRITEQLYPYSVLAGRSFWFHRHLIRGPPGTEAEQMPDFKIISLQLCINILFQSCPKACSR